MVRIRVRASMSAVVLVPLLARAALASVTLSFDKLNCPEPGWASIPDNFVIVDVHADVSDGDWWAAAAIVGITLNSALLVFDYDSGDPDLAWNGSNNPWRGIVSQPFPERYHGVPSVPVGAALSGRFCPVGPYAIVIPFEINISYFAHPPPPSDAPTVDGWVLRIALNVEFTGFSPNQVRAFVIGTQPAGAVPLFLTHCADESLPAGMVATTGDEPALQSNLEFGIYGVVEMSGVWSEGGNIGGDAGDLPDTAQEITGAGGLFTVAGRLGGQDVDMYAMYINNPGQVSMNPAILECGGLNPAIYIFAQDGRAIVMNDDDPRGGTPMPYLTGNLLPGTGRYYMAIGDRNLMPVNRAGLPIWSERGAADAARAPDGPGADDPFIARWIGESTEAADYEIQLAGAQFLSTPCPGDVNGDRVVDLSDLSVLLANFGRDRDARSSDGDLDGDGDVDLEDLARLLANFGSTC